METTRTSTSTQVRKFRLLNTNEPVNYSNESTFSNYQYTWLLVNFAQLILNKEPFVFEIVQNSHRLCVTFFVKTEKDSSTWLYYKADVCYKDYNQGHYSISPGTEFKLSVINGNKEKKHTIKIQFNQELRYINVNELPHLYINDESIRLFLEMTFSTTNPSTNIQQHDIVANQIKEHETLSKDLSHFAYNRNFSDFTYYVSSMEFPVHKVILAARSKYWKDFFSYKNSKECLNGYATIDNIESDVFASLILYIYTANFPSCEKLTTSLWNAADYFDIEEMKNYIEKHMPLSNDNIIEVIELVYSTDSAPALKNRCRYFISKHNSIFDQKSWKDLEEKNHKLTETVLKDVVSAFGGQKSGLKRKL